MGVKKIRRQFRVVDNLGQETLPGRVAIVQRGDGIGRHDSLDFMVVGKLLDIRIPVLVDRIAPLEAEAQRQVRALVELQRDCIVARRQDAHLLRKMTLHHVRTLVRHEDARLLQPILHDDIQRVHTAALVVGHILRGQRLCSLVRDLVAVVARPDLRHIAMVRGKEHTVVRDEDDALSERICPVILLKLRSPLVRLALVKRRCPPVKDPVLTVQPRVPAERRDHLVEQLASPALLLIALLAIVRLLIAGLATRRLHLRSNLRAGQRRSLRTGARRRSAEHDHYQARREAHREKLRVAQNSHCSLIRPEPRRR